MSQAVAVDGAPPGRDPSPPAQQTSSASNDPVPPPVSVSDTTRQEHSEGSAGSEGNPKVPGSGGGGEGGARGGQQQQQQQQQQKDGDVTVPCSWQDIKSVQNLIERCLNKFMTQTEIIAALQVEANVDPSFTCLVWQKLEQQNPEFFFIYHVRLRMRDQIVAFNYLVDQQVYMIRLATANMAHHPPPPGFPQHPAMPHTHGIPQTQGMPQQTQGMDRPQPSQGAQQGVPPAAGLRPEMPGVMGVPSLPIPRQPLSSNSAPVPAGNVLSSAPVPTPPGDVGAKSPPPKPATVVSAGAVTQPALSTVALPADTPVSAPAATSTERMSPESAAAATAAADRAGLVPLQCGMGVSRLPGGVSTGGDGGLDVAAAAEAAAAGAAAIAAAGGLEEATGVVGVGEQAGRFSPGVGAGGVVSGSQGAGGALGNDVMDVDVGGDTDYIVDMFRS